MVKCKVIAVSGFDGSGKSRLAQQLSNEFLVSVSSFAYQLREELAGVLGIPPREAHGKPTLSYVRDLLRGWGEYQKARHGEDYWANKLIQFTKGKDALIIDDLRFIPEYQTLIQQVDPLFISISTPGEIPDISSSRDLDFISAMSDIRKPYRTLLTSSELDYIHSFLVTGHRSEL